MTIFSPSTASFRLLKKTLILKLNGGLGTGMGSLAAKTMVSTIGFSWGSPIEGSHPAGMEVKHPAVALAMVGSLNSHKLSVSTGFCGVPQVKPPVFFFLRGEIENFRHFEEKKRTFPVETNYRVIFH